ncbi:MAG: hypothetical protein KAX49_09460 [Halanaerobiales bacterium]|nr:hypothetical protein [Halanaerobiales bacterium]
MILYDNGTTRETVTRALSKFRKLG